MVNNGLIEKIYCAKFSITLDNRKVDKCAFVSAPSAAEAWDLTETLAAFWNTEKKTADFPFKIHRIYKEPCSSNPIMVWSKAVLNRVRKQLGFNRSFENQLSS